MENIEKKINKLKQQGYDYVYVWKAEPNEEDSDHIHSFDTHLVILDGEIEIRIGDQSRLLKLNNELDIPKNTTHYGKTGKHGCKYIVAERY